MVGVDFTSVNTLPVELDEEGCSSLLPAQTQDWPPLHDALAVSVAVQDRPPCRTARALAAAAVSLLLAGSAAAAAAAVATRGPRLAVSARPATGALELFSWGGGAVGGGGFGASQDQWGHTVCNACPTPCDCAWASQPNACTASPSDGTCCWSCCCSGQGSYSGAAGVPSPQVEQHASYDADTTSWRGDVPEARVEEPDVSVQQPVVYHAYDDYVGDEHTEYQPGQRVFVQARDGHWRTARIVSSAARGSSYQVRYLMSQDTELVSSIHISPVHGLMSADTTWIVLIFVVFAMAALGFYRFVCSPRR